MSGKIMAKSKMILSALLAGLFVVTLFNTVFDAEYVNAAFDENAGWHNYTYNWGHVTRSYIIKMSGGGYMLFEAIDDYYVEYRDSSFNVTKTLTVPRELTLFGAFATDGTNFYILSGQNNGDQDDDRECYRVTKYNSNWERVGACSVNNCNTTAPFSCGQSEMVNIGTTLLVKTDHTMYTSSDNLRHQSNYEIVVNTSDMSLLKKGNSVGYSSHSFNQFARVYDGKFYGVSHGDAYPRAVMITKYESLTNGKKVNAIEIPGAVGANYTGLRLGGFEVSDTTMLTAGTCMDYSLWNEATSQHTRNVFVSVTSKSDDTTTMKWFTDRAPGAKHYGNPFLVKVNNNKYAVLWEEYEYGSTKFSYVFIDKNGDQLGDISSFNGYLSDCQPIYSNGKLVWFVVIDDPDTNALVTQIYTLDVSTGAVRIIQPTKISEATVTGLADKTYDPSDDSIPAFTLEYDSTVLTEGRDYEVTGTRVSGGKGYITVEGRGNFIGSTTLTYNIIPKDVSELVIEPVSDITYTRSKITPEPVIMYGDVTLVKNTDYTLTYSDNTNVGVATITITGKGNYTGTAEVTFNITPVDLADCTASGISAKTYTGNPITPSVKIKYGSYVLKADTDYTLSYSDNVDVGMATVTATGTGNYTGSVSVQFEITEEQVPIDEDTYTWVKKNGKWYYVDQDGDPVTGFALIGGKYYFFLDSGVMVTGWLKYNDVWYFFNTSGAMVKGWQKISNKWYYFEESGEMVTGWKQIGSTWYLFAGSGAMLTGWQKVDDVWYYLASSGAMKTGWQKISKKWYFFDENGKMLTGLQQIGDNYCLFNGSGAMQTGWKSVDGEWYYFNTSGYAAKGWKKISKKWYWFYDDGRMIASDSFEENGKVYEFDDNGVCINP
ncbi:Glucan-binding domain-containing protein (YG repeat) [Ruminococcaceae bacterium YRB3002]|nr:Glucan-binding domain-containing protein (YG repeat) [Ruminococcaceae bacterium YRB3002]